MRGVGGRGGAGERGVDRGRRAPAVGDGVDQVARTPRDVAPGPDAGIGRSQRLGIYLHAAGTRALEVDARIEEAHVGSLADREDHGVGGNDGFRPGLEGRGEAPFGVEHRRHRDRLESGEPGVADEAVRSLPVHDPDPLALGLVDLLGIGRYLGG